MSLNTAHADHGVLIHARECIILFSDNVSVEFYGNDTPEFHGSKQGRMYLTTHRMIFNSKSPAEPLRSFSFPFITLEDVAVEQPMFSANYIKGKIHAQPNGNFIGEVKFKIVFKSGGAIEFGQAMLKAAHLATRHAVPDSQPPPYSPPTGPWYAAPPPAYAPAPQGYYGCVPPYTAFPDQPPPNSVFVSNNPPPYPGVMGRPYPPGTGYSGVSSQDSPSPTGAGFPQGPSAPPGYPGAPAGMSSNVMSTNEAEDQMEASSSDSEDEVMEGEDENDDRPKTYLPGQPLKEDEHLVCDQSAYVMLHQAQTGAPCLSFDVVPDNLGNNRNEYPMTAYLVAGTQASSAHLNNLLVIKMSNLYQTSKAEDAEESDEDEDDNDEEEDEEKKPQMTFSFIKHQGCVNRIRATSFKNSVLAASWSELGRVDIWNITQQLQAVDDPALLERYNLDTVKTPVKPLYSFNGHQQEGFGIDWCPTEHGVLATGDCRRDIHIWKPNQAGTWEVDQRPLVGHTSSVEDIQWSPNERNVLASCSMDKSIRIWDTRAAPQKACMLAVEGAHQSDVNVISWNRQEPFIASGGDDGFVHIWDLRQLTDKTPVGTFKHHTAPVTSIEWHWTEPSVLASAGEDHQVALWDLAVERDDDDVVDEELNNLPPQLLFIHQGQSDIKELHWHKQMPGVMVTTAHTGFNIFKSISV